MGRYYAQLKQDEQIEPDMVFTLEEAENIDPEPECTSESELSHVVGGELCEYNIDQLSYFRWYYDALPAARMLNGRTCRRRICEHY